MQSLVATVAFAVAVAAAVAANIAVAVEILLFCSSASDSDDRKYVVAL